MEIPKIQCGIGCDLSMEEMLDTLADEGLRPKKMESDLLRFSRNDKNYLARCFEEDSTLLMLSAPRIYEFSERDNKVLILEQLNRINAEAYVAKIHAYEDSVWVTVEVRHQRMGTVAGLLNKYIDDIDHVVKMFFDVLLNAGERQSETLL